MRILIAEDNAENRDMLLRRLQRKGFDVEAVANGAEAVAAVGARPVDLVLMDVSMPVMSGLEATAKIRALDDEKSRTPIIALTAHAMAPDEDRCLSAGCDAFMTKPVDFHALLTLVRLFDADQDDRNSSE